MFKFFKTCTRKKKSCVPNYMTLYLQVTQLWVILIFLIVILFFFFFFCKEQVFCIQKHIRTYFKEKSPTSHEHGFINFEMSVLADGKHPNLIFHIIQKDYKCLKTVKCSNFISKHTFITRKGNYSWLSLRCGDCRSWNQEPQLRKHIKVTPHNAWESPTHFPQGCLAF